jgi:integrase/recombinase XerD
MLERIITKVLAQVGDLPAETIQKIRIAMTSELNDYDLVPKSKELVLYTGTPQQLKLFLASKKVDGAAQTTLKNYGLILTKFLARLQKDPVTVTTSDIRMYLAIRETEGLNKKSISTLLACLKSFYGWLENEEYIVKSPCRKIPSIKTPKHVRKALNAEELEKIRIACKTLRDKALVEFFYSTGCRLDEVYKLNREDINWKDDCCMVMGKGSKEREVYTNAKAHVYLQRYMESRKDNSPALFVGERAPHERLGRRMIEKVFSKLGKAAGLNKAVFPHLVRHTTATMALHSGAEITFVQKMLGHENADTTLIYAEVNTDQIWAAHKKHVA